MSKYQIGQYYTCRDLLDDYTITYQVESLLGDRVYINIIHDTREYIFYENEHIKKDWFALGSHYDRSSKPYIDMDKELENV